MNAWVKKIYLFKHESVLNQSSIHSNREKRKKSKTWSIYVVGHGIVAATASIPSKYQTIVTDNSDKRGFGAQAKRFQSDYAMVKFKIWCVLINQSTFSIA